MRFRTLTIAISEAGSHLSRARALLVTGLTALVVCLMALPALAAPGDVDLSFGPTTITHNSGAAIVRVIVPLPNGQMLIAGDFSEVNGQPRSGIARLNADGTVDGAFIGPQFPGGTIRAIHVAADGSILIGGRFYAGNELRRLAWLTPIGTLNFAINLQGNIDTQNDVVETMLVESDGVVLGGHFYFVKDVSSPGIVKVNATTGDVIAPLGATAFLSNDGSAQLWVESLVRLNDGSLIAGGQFQSATPAPTVRGLIKLRPDGTRDVGFISTGTDTPARIYSIAVEPDGQLLVAGDFTSINTIQTPRLARLHPDGALNLTHAPLDMFGAGAAFVMLRQTDGRYLVGGALGPINNTTRNGIARFNADFSLDPFYPEPGGINGSVYATAIDASGRVLIGGLFTTVGGVSRIGIARLLDTVNNAPQLTDVSVTPSVDENGSVTLTGSVSDNDGDELTLSVNWGDGSTVTSATYASGAPFSHSHQYLDDSPSNTSSDQYSISVSLNDGHGGTDSESVATTVNNVAPTLSNVALSADTIAAGSSVTLSGTIGDAGTLDPHTVEISWGDGSSGTTLPLSAAVASFQAQHQYNASGSFTIGVSVSDDDLGSASDNTMTIVVNPSLQPPSAPTNFNAVVTWTRAGKNKIYSASLMWTDTSNNEAGFAIQRLVKGKKKACVPDTAFSATAPENATSYTDATATSSTCGYQIRSENANGSSAWIRDINTGTGIVP